MEDDENVSTDNTKYLNDTANGNSSKNNKSAKSNPNQDIGTFKTEVKFLQGESSLKSITQTCTNSPGPIDFDKDTEKNLNDKIREMARKDPLASYAPPTYANMYKTNKRIQEKLKTYRSRIPQLLELQMKEKTHLPPQTINTQNVRKPGSYEQRIKYQKSLKLRSDPNHLIKHSNILIQTQNNMTGHPTVNYQNPTSDNLQDNTDNHDDSPVHDKDNADNLQDKADNNPVHDKDNADDLQDNADNDDNNPVHEKDNADNLQDNADNIDNNPVHDKNNIDDHKKNTDNHNYNADSSKSDEISRVENDYAERMDHQFVLKFRDMLKDYLGAVNQVIHSAEDIAAANDEQSNKGKQMSDENGTGHEEIHDLKMF
ncbi:unnamed protein product [Owenia fusiformis]|uniref:Uncharacterized protein n=1 Tax=Owenia fusiformis TaxID=6347 RepID=A0A8S4PII4_OWEFU|nr:unnamed protein product [Owenia fusiformis]